MDIPQTLDDVSFHWIDERLALLYADSPPASDAEHAATRMTLAVKMTTLVVKSTVFRSAMDRSLALAALAKVEGFLLRSFPISDVARAFERLGLLTNNSPNPVKFSCTGAAKTRGVACSDKKNGA
jgi:hypothetical protein